MEKLNNNKVGLAVGCFFALAHVLWFLLIAVLSQKTMQDFVNWMLKMHSVGVGVQVLAIDRVNALLLVVLALVIGYIAGWVFSVIFNRINKKK